MVGPMKDEEGGGARLSWESLRLCCIADKVVDLWGKECSLEAVCQLCSLQVKSEFFLEETNLELCDIWRKIRNILSCPLGTQSPLSS